MAVELWELGKYEKDPDLQTTPSYGVQFGFLIPALSKLPQNIMHRLNAALCSMRTEMQHVHFCFAVSGPTVSSEPWMSRFVSGDGEVVSMATFVPSSCTFSFLHILCISSLKQFWLVWYVLCLWCRFDRWWEETERGWKKASRGTGRRRRDRKQMCSTAHFSVSIFSPFVANVMAQSTHASAGCSW